ncbi:hypothetical protein R0131_04135 [Clostridium sp. AL.422]|uniref:hypothetical protein n=1 Tax=Clostridium TaxID=1485 RepID=UPI00293DA76C|nr:MULTISPECIES: hypothetical protein [unclassified Clostridium]MDV4150019.1 hypothetical protein [Clostridium sp. AL.422]
MPGVFNIGNSYNVNNKRISSKLTFDIGEKFSGKIIKKEGSNEVTIRLIDGWEFQAEIDGDMESLGRGFNRFQVEGFEEGKLKLKLISSNVKGDELAQGEFSEIILKEGLSNEDINLLKELIKFNIPLTKENIKEIKGLFQFLNRVHENTNEVDEFISKYLLSKGIDENGVEGKNIKNTLKEFFYELKSLSKQDILLFFENNIELSKENIKGYKNIFKSENSILDIFDNITASLPELKAEVSNKSISLKEELDSNINSKGIVIDKNNFNEVNTKIQEKNINNKIGNEVYQKTENASTKISLLSLLKSISGQTEDYINVNLKEILTNRRLEFTSGDFDRTFNLINTLKPEEFIESLKSIIAEFRDIGGAIVSDNFSDYVSKRNNVALGITEALEFTKGEVEVLLSKLMGKGVTLTEEEFTKLKDGINLKYQEIIDKEKPSQGGVTSSTLESERTKINDFTNNIEVKSNKDVNLSTKDIVKNSITKTGELSKEIINDLITTIKNDGSASEKILDLIKNNIDEIKLFNKISSEYYYADIPINIRETEYPCKIIIKDKRKDSKKIDSTNIKIVITIDTKNLGVVDSYMKILDKKINVDLKCEERYVKIIDMAKIKLAYNIESMGFLVDIKVSKKEEEVSLATCRAFFNPDSGTAIDRRV